MKRQIVVALLALIPVVLSGQQPPRVAANLDGGEWLVEGAGRAGDVKIDTFLGRRSLWLRNSTQAIKSGARLIDGTIEFDVAPMAHGDFVARTEWPRNQWTHVRVEVSGSRLEVFVANGAMPVVSVPRLRHGSTTAADVAFWARVNDTPAEWAAALSNIEIRPASSNAPRTTAPSAPAQYISRWDVAGPVKADRAITAVPSGLDWTAVAAEDSGLVNLNAVLRAQGSQGRFTAYARAFIDAPAARRMMAGIGYSDDVTVIVNGEPIYSGINGWNARTPDYISFVNADFERVWLPLKAGRNEIVLAVTDHQIFGWGFAVKLVEPVND